jgi:hypothetical protein
MARLPFVLLPVGSLNGLSPGMISVCNFFNSGSTYNYHWAGQCVRLPAILTTVINTASTLLDKTHRREHLVIRIVSMF